MTPPEHGAAVGALRGPVDLARLVWAARGERSRLHRLAVDSSRQEADDHARLEAGDANVYRCSGCGAWRYRSNQNARPNDRVTCPYCGTHRGIRKAAA